jgi:hypothetical protein
MRPTTRRPTAKKAPAKKAVAFAPEPPRRTRTRTATSRAFGRPIPVMDNRTFSQMVASYDAAMKSNHAFELNREFAGEIDPVMTPDDLSGSMTINLLTADIESRSL